MVSDPAASMAKGAVVEPEKPAARSLPNKNNKVKVPKKLHKAEREKLKRDHLNELFLELGHALEPARQNNGKACILGDTARLLQDLIAQVESLRKENAALVTESHYVTAEKNELRDENTALETKISRLQNELRERMQSDSMWCNSTDANPPTHQPTSTALPMPESSIRPLYVIPLHQDFQPCSEAGTAPTPPNPPSRVKKPHARYPTPSDSWPLELLSRHPRTEQDGRSSREEGSDKASAGPCNK